MTARNTPYYPRWGEPGIICIALDHPTHAPSLAEANLLAVRLVKLDESDMQLLEGIVRHRGSYDIIDVINATHNLHRFSYYPGIVSDRQIGEFAIENEITPELEALSDEMLDCLDNRKIGAKLRRDEGGILTPTGYIVPMKLGWDIIYDVPWATAHSKSRNKSCKWACSPTTHLVSP